MRTTEELMVALVDHMKMIRASVEEYARGDHFEVPRIATAISTIVNEAYADSILKQMHEKDNITFVVSAIIERDGNLFSDHPLISLQLKHSSPRFEPIWLEASKKGAISEHRYASGFEGWWEKIPIFKTPGYYFRDYGPKSRILTRRGLVQTYRNQDGGAHYARDVKEPVYKMIKESGVGWEASTSEGNFDPIAGALDAMLVQVGLELLSTLLSKFPQIPANLR
jgi:hypothetical protein